MPNSFNYFVDYNHASDASIIDWIEETTSIEGCEAFVDFIRCDEDGSDYVFLYSDENDFEYVMNNFAAIPGDNDGEFFACYTADFAIDLDAKPRFAAALEHSDWLVEVVLGFKDKDGNTLEDCFQEHSNRTARLTPIED